MQPNDTVPCGKAVDHGDRKQSETDATIFLVESEAISQGDATPGDSGLGYQVAGSCMRFHRQGSAQQVGCILANLIVNDYNDSALLEV